MIGILDANFEDQMPQLLNAIDNKDIVEKIISKNGYSAEHNYFHFLYNCDNGEEPLCFIDSDDDLGCANGLLVFFDVKGSNYRIFSDILASPEDRINCLKSFLDYVFAHGAKKVNIETTMEFREDLLKNLNGVGSDSSERNGSEYIIRKPTTIFTWPVYDMNKWDGDLMQGKEWKDIRYYWNKYFKEHKLEFKTAQEIDKQVLKDLVLKWKSQRTGDRITFYKYHLNVIEGGFLGYDSRIMIVDGVVTAITAGFKIPNKNYYYSSIGIYSRDIDRTGEIANMDDLIQLKKKGYDFVDFGGGEDSLTEFKKKFKPTYFYKTYVYNIVKGEK